MHLQRGENIINENNNMQWACCLVMDGKAHASGPEAGLSEAKLGYGYIHSSTGGCLQVKRKAAPQHLTDDFWFVSNTKYRVGGSWICWPYNHTVPRSYSPNSAEPIYKTPDCFYSPVH